MKTPLNKVNKKINIENYSLKDLAEYFEKLVHINYYVEYNISTIVLTSKI